MSRPIEMTQEPVQRGSGSPSSMRSTPPDPPLRNPYTPNEPVELSTVAVKVAQVEEDADPVCTDPAISEPWKKDPVPPTSSSKIPFIIAFVVFVVLVVAIVPPVVVTQSNGDSPLTNWFLPAPRNTEFIGGRGLVVSDPGNFSRLLLPLRVVGFLPQTGTVLQGQAALAIIFSKSVIRLGSDDDSDGASPPQGVSLTCQQGRAVGSWRWVSTSILRFDPKTSWANDLSCTLRVDPSLQSWDGSVLDLSSGSNSMQFTTPPLTFYPTRVTSDTLSKLTDGHWDGVFSRSSNNWVSQYEVPIDGNVELTFSAEVNATLVAQYLVAQPTASSNPSKAFVLNGSCATPSTSCVRGYFGLDYGLKYSVQIPQGSVVSNNGGALTTPATAQLFGLLPFELLPAQWSSVYSRMLTLYLRHSVAPGTPINAFDSVVSISPSVGGIYTKILNNWTLLVHANILPDTTYTLSFAASSTIRDGFSQPLQPSSMTFTTNNIDGRALIEDPTTIVAGSYAGFGRLSSSSFMLPRDAPLPVFRQFTKNRYVSYSRQYALFKTGKQLDIFFENGSLPSTSTVTFTDSSPAMTTLVPEVSLEKTFLESGLFGAGSSAGVVLSRVPEQYWGGLSWFTNARTSVSLIVKDSTVSAWVSDISSTAPVALAGVTVKFYGQPSYGTTPATLIGTAITSPDGVATIQLSAQFYRYAVTVTGADGAALACLSEVAAAGSGSTPSEVNVVISLDRKMYRIGEAVQLSGAVRIFENGTYRFPRLGEFLVDLNPQWTDGGMDSGSSFGYYGGGPRNSASVLNTSTDALGVFQIALNVPANARYGARSISVMLRDRSTNQYRNTQFVSAIVADPRIPSAVLTCKPSAPVGVVNSTSNGRVNVKCSTKTYMGTAIAQASITVTCTATPSTILGYSPVGGQLSSVTLPDQSLVTGDDGEGEISVTLSSNVQPPTSQDSTAVQCTANYISPTRETLVQSASFVVRRSLITISAIQPSLNQPMPTLPTNLSVSLDCSNNVDGKPSTSVEAALYSAGGVKLSVTACGQKSFDSSTGTQVATCSVVLPSIGKYTVKVTATDANGDAVEATQDLGFTKEEWDNNPLSRLPDFAFSLDKTAYGIDDTAFLQVDTVVPRPATLIVSCGANLYTYMLPSQLRSTVGLPSTCVSKSVKSIPVAIQTGTMNVADIPSIMKDFAGAVSDLTIPTFTATELPIRYSPAQAPLEASISFGAQSSGVQQLSIALSQANVSVQSGEIVVDVVDEAILSLAAPDSVDGSQVLNQGLSYTAMTATTGWSQNITNLVADRLEKLVRENPWTWIASLDLNRRLDLILMQTLCQITAFPWVQSYWNVEMAADAGGAGGGMIAGAMPKNLAPGPLTTLAGSASRTSGSPASPNQRLRASEKPATLYSTRVTVSNGVAQLSVPLDKYLGTWTVRVLSVSADPLVPVGVASSSFTVNKPLTLTASTPRVVRYGDNFTAGVVVELNSAANLPSASVTVKVNSVCAALAMLSPDSKTVNLQIRRPQEVLFAFSATGYDEACEIGFTATAASSTVSDSLAAQFSVLAPLPRQVSGTAFAIQAGVPATEGFYFPLAVPLSGSIDVAISASHLSSVEKLKLMASDRIASSGKGTSTYLTWLETAVARCTYEPAVKAPECKLMTKDPLYTEALAVLSRRTSPNLGLVESDESLLFYNDWIDIQLNARALYVIGLVRQNDGNVDNRIGGPALFGWSNSIQNALQSRNPDGTVKYPQSVDSALDLYFYLGSSMSLPSGVPTFNQVLDHIDVIGDYGRAKVLGLLMQEQARIWGSERESIASHLTSNFTNALRITGRTAYIGSNFEANSGQGYPLPMESQCFILTAVNYYALQSAQVQTLDSTLRSKLALYVAAGEGSGQSWWVYQSDLGLRARTLATYDGALSLSSTPNLSVNVIQNQSGTLNPLYTVSYNSVAALRDTDTRNFTWDTFAASPAQGRSESSLTFSANGQGEAVAVLQLQYVPLLPSTPRTVYHGLFLQKVLRRVSSNGAKTVFQPLTEVLAVGDLVEVQLSVTTPDSVSNVILEDYLPGGLEAMDPNLATGYVSSSGADLSPAYSSWGWCFWRWWWYFMGFSAPEIMRDKVKCTATYLSPGTYNCVYFARAVTSGSFVLPGVQGYLQQQPEVGGSSAHSFLTVGTRIV